MTLIIEISLLVGTHLVLAASGWLVGKYYTKKKKIKQFYKGLKPVITFVSSLRKNGIINQTQAKQFIQTISNSFKMNFEIGTMLTKDFGEYEKKQN